MKNTIHFLYIYAIHIHSNIVNKIVNMTSNLCKVAVIQVTSSSVTRNRMGFTIVMESTDIFKWLLTPSRIGHV